MENDFEKRMKDWQNERLTDAEKALMLERIFAAPMPSPYARYMRLFVYVKRPAIMALVLCLLFSTSLAYASQSSLPGDKLYAVKTRFVEPLVGVVATRPTEKLEWEQEKVVRRISEAQALSDKNELDESKVKEIEKSIEKSSASFGDAAEEVSKQATSTEKQIEKREDLKRQFRESLQIGKGKERGASSSEMRIEKNAQVEHLKERALKALDDRREGDRKGRD